MPITKIIHTGDIHIRNLRRIDEYRIILEKFVSEASEIANENGSENTRIVIAGDLVHNKIDISPECYAVTSWFLKKLDKICKTIVIAGNHDKITNASRLDPLSSIFSMCKFNQTYYLDKECNYESGCIIDDNVVWCLYSSFDGFAKPNITEYKAQYPTDEFYYLGLFHGELKSSCTDVGYVSENGLETSYFDEIDACLMGHIHKRQELDFRGTKLVYCGSLIQQDHGENISNHGYVVWSLNDGRISYENHDIKNDDYGFFTFSIDNSEAFIKKEEKILNL